MKRKWSLLLFFIFNFAYGQEYLLYTQKPLTEIQKQIQQFDEDAKIKDVFSDKELDMFRSLGVQAQSLRVKTHLNLRELSKIFKDIVIEQVGEFELYNNYESYQWGLNNLGGEFTRWVSDIDQRIIHADSREDINIGETQENIQRQIKVAIIDSGVDLSHPDLKDQILTKPKECAALKIYQECLIKNSDKDMCHKNYASVDTDNNGYPLDCQGWSFTNSSYPTVNVTGNPEIIDGNGHGTHVAGIIGALKNNHGISGVAQNVDIIPIQVAMNSTSSNPIENIAKGVLYAIQNNAQVINLSLGWRSQFDLKLMRDLIAAAIKKDILVVVAAGNDAHDDITYPCAYEDVICVGAHDPSGELTNYSNFGTQVDLIAPGDRILSSWPTLKRSRQFTLDYNYEYLSGTSQAAPFVSGVLAKLLNAGLSPSKAYISLLKGAREKKEISPIRFGNLDYKKALKSNSKGLLYPLNKTPYLIKWTEGSEHKFRLRLKNYGQSLKNAEIEITSLSTDQKVIKQKLLISSLGKNQIYEQDITFSDQEQSSSEIYFNIKIKAHGSVSKFLIKTQFIRLINNESQHADISSFELKDKISEEVVLRPFDNITHHNTTDFFVNHQKKGQDFISVLKNENGVYRRSRPLKIKESKPVFLNFSKVDIDLNGQADYVVMYLYKDKDKNKITKFIVFDHQLKIKRVLIAPENSFDNGMTFIPGKFRWIEHNKRLVPAWIGYGENPSPQISPWESQDTGLGNHFYFLSPKGLKKLDLPSDLIPLHTLYPSTKMLTHGEVEFLATEEFGFKKQYKRLHYQDGLLSYKALEFNEYFDLSETMPLSMSLNITNAFYHEHSIEGDENIYILKERNGILTSEFERLSNPFAHESIQFVPLITDDYTIAQTNHKLLLTNRKTQAQHSIVSKVNTKFRKYKPLIASQALYLPSIEAPGMTSELIYTKNAHKLISHRKYRVFATNDCAEFGVVQQQTKESIGFFCPQSQKILLLSIQLNKE